MTDPTVRDALWTALQNEARTPGAYIRRLAQMGVYLVTEESLARAFQHIDTPVGAIYPPIQPYIDKAAAILRTLGEASDDR